MKQLRLYGSLLALVLTLADPRAHAEFEGDLGLIKLPPGFQIDLYAEDVANARQMALGDMGTLFVGSYRMDLGQIYAVVDSDGDHKADKVHVLWTRDQKLPDGSQIMMPSGLAFKDGSLYVSAISHVLRWDNIEDNLENPGDPVIVTDKFPDARHHGWKFIAFGPDDKLYVPVGAPCNICPEREGFMNIQRMNADGSGREVVARGVRNTVGFDWHPETGELWFTDNGGDNLGDDMPADELNRVSVIGQHFGFPFVHQGDTLDQREGKGKNIADFEPPAQKLGPHVAALGMRFYTGDMFPAEYKNRIFIAEHGSWNRSSKSGYRITMVTEEGGKGTSYEPFATGWLQSETPWGRPADVMQMPDGSLLVSDDRTNAIYRISYK